MRTRHHSFPFTWLAALTLSCFICERVFSAAHFFQDSPTASTNGPILHVRFVNVGQGDCTVARLPNGKILMVDCGSTAGGDSAKIKREVQAMLNPTDKKIDALVVTHPDADHYNRIEHALDGVDVEKIFITGSMGDYTVADFDVWLQSFPPNTVTPLLAADWNKTVPKLLGDFSTNVFVLAADVEDVSVGSVKNTKSITLKISYDQFDLIVGGDATFDTENSITNRYSSQPAFLDVELLKLGHHGSWSTSTSDGWLRAVKPEWAVVSAGFNNSYGHPHSNVISRVEAHTISVAPHVLRWSWKQNNVSKYKRFASYTEAIFTSSTSGTIDLYSDGTVHPVLRTEK